MTAFVVERKSSKFLTKSRTSLEPEFHRCSPKKVGANEVMGCFAIGSSCIGLGRDHWIEMLDNPETRRAVVHPSGDPLRSDGGHFHHGQILPHQVHQYEMTVREKSISPSASSTGL
ncbi:hypothetical protein CEXT_575701 [Caerostris extrusa]|uniref:Uncharacterized protein n=1 Tax=Caerostris extrusa TaxID=172846 RepID=A0AAV4XN75_CAEEX|nr:hypothetical protein CEXT_575701 [Caerostris extrusa]